MVGEGRQLRDIRLQGGEDSAVCAVCQRSVAITKAGQVRVHGPIGNRCLGSRSLPTVAAVPHPSLAIATSSDVRSPALSSTAGVCSQSLASPLLCIPYLRSTLFLVSGYHPSIMYLRQLEICGQGWLVSCSALLPPTLLMLIPGASFSCLPNVC